MPPTPRALWLVLAACGCAAPTPAPRDADLDATADARASDAPIAPDSPAAIDAPLSIDSPTGRDACVPDCWLNECGDDRCGGSCGHCLTGATCIADGRCDCPASSCGARTCGTSGCGRHCGDCGPLEACSMGACVPRGSCAGTPCRDRSFQWFCAGGSASGPCPGDPSRDAVCSCDASGALACTGTCFVSVPIACRDGTCGAGMRCDPWTGRCEPNTAPFPPPGADVGAPCTAAADCRSAGGIGAALVPACTHGVGADFAGGYCLAYCNAPPGGFFSSDPLARSNCPAGSICLPDGQVDPTTAFGACVHECTADSDCRVAEGYFCHRSFGGRTYANGYCAPLHCRTRGCMSLQCGC